MTPTEERTRIPTPCPPLLSDTRVVLQGLEGARRKFYVDLISAFGGAVAVEAEEGVTHIVVAGVRCGYGEG